jgi:hypothetical protein
MPDSLSDRVTKPKKKLERLLVLVSLLSTYYFLFIYQDVLGLEIPLLSLKSLVALPAISVVVIPLIRYVVVLPDPLQRSPSRNPTVRFFQEQFPSRYLLERCCPTQKPNPG